MAGNHDFFSKNTGSEEQAPQVPFYKIKDDKEPKLLQWLKNEVVFREKAHANFFKKCRRNLLCYKNDYYKVQGSKRQSESLEYVPHQRTSKYVVNHLYEMTENLVSRMTRLKPAVEVLPANDEFEDKNSAKAVKLLVKHLWYINDVDFLLQKIHRHKYIFGEAYVFIEWDKEKGDLHPDYIKLRDSGKLDELGELKEKVNANIRTGDVCYDLKLPFDVLLEVNPDYNKVKNVLVKEKKHVEDIKKMYPKKANVLRIPKDYEKTDSCEMEVYTFYHKVCDDLPQGRMIKFVEGCILEDEALPYSHGGFPFIRITDLDVPGSLHGVSRYDQALMAQNAHNNLSTTMMKNEFLMGAPKWIMPRKACNVEQLANGRTVVQYQGNVPPQLVQMNPTSPTTFNLREKTELEIGTMMGVAQVSRGEPPQGITAAVALQFLNEQENERSSSDIAKHNQLVVDLAKMSISLAGDKYEIDDGRMLRILGKENKYMIKYFDSANLHKDYDIRIQNSSALPETKAGRTERIFQTLQYASHLFPAERWAELLEFGSTEKMHTLATEAINSAESQVEDLLEGNFVEEPQVWEDSLTHLRVLYKKFQSRSFKEEVPPEIRERFIEFTMAHEMLAFEKAKKNPLFGSKLAQLDLFPMFFQPAEVPQSAEQRKAIAEGQANRGEEVTTQIPAEEPEEVPGQLTKNGSKK